MSSLWRVPVALACLSGGAALAVCTVALHGYWWGLVLGAAATVAVLVALPAAWWSRLPLGLGWVAVLAVAAPARPEGDYLVAGDVGGYLLLAFGGGVFVAGVIGLVPRRRATVDAAPGGGAT